MAQTIARIYANQDKAAAALNALRDRGFRADVTHLIAQPVSQEPTPRDAGTSIDPVMEAMTRVGLTPEQASIYAPRVHGGEALVAVEAQFGTALLATTVLDEAGPIPVTVPEVEYSSGVDWHSPTPLSSALGIPVLLSDATPLSRFLNWRALKPQPASSATLNSVRKQSRQAAPLSNTLKLPLLSDDAAPLSSKLKFPVLFEKAAPLSEKLQWKAVYNDPAPLSEKTNLPLLSNNPAPLSSLLGLPVLSKRR